MKLARCALAFVMAWGGVAGLVAARAGEAATQPSSAATTAPADPALWRQLVAIDGLARQVKDLSADFEQRKYTPLLRKPLVSKGSIRVVGSAMLWDTVSPEPTKMRIGEREIRIYYPRQKVMEVYPVDRQLGALAASPLPRLEVLKRYFSFEQIPAGELAEGRSAEHLIALRLTPIDASLREHLEQVRVLLDAESGLILRAEMTDADGDRTSIVFSGIKTNTGLKEADVAVDAPPDAKVTHPLDGLGDAPRGEGPGKQQ